MQHPTDQVCFGVGCAHYVFFCTYFTLQFAFIFLILFFSWFAFLCDANSPFINVAIIKLVLHFFYYFISVIFGMWWHLSCAIIYLFVCLLILFLILYMHFGASLIFWSHFALCFIVFYRHITHVCNCSMLARCWRCQSLVLSNLHSLWIRFFCTTDFSCCIFR